MKPLITRGWKEPVTGCEAMPDLTPILSQGGHIMNTHINPIFGDILDAIIPLDISQLPQERGDLDYEVLGWDPDGFGGEAA